MPPVVRIDERKAKERNKGGEEQYLLFPLFVPLECGGAPCLLGLVVQELCSSLFLFEHVEFVVQGFLLVLHFLFLVLVELLQTVKLLMQLLVTRYLCEREQKLP